MSEPNGKKLDNLYKLAWVRGLKTPITCARWAPHTSRSRRWTKPARNKLNAVKVTALDGGTAAPQACSILDPDCEACQ